MNPTLESSSQPWSLGLFSAFTQLLDYLPQLFGAIVIWLVGLVTAKVVRKVVVETLSALKLSAAMEKTPLGLFLKNAEIKQKIEDILGSLAYWLILLVFSHAVVSLLGLETLTGVFNRIFDYLPHVFAAMIIFIFGVVMAGVVESLVKGSLHEAGGGHTGRFFSKVASYMVITISLLAGVAELGIASEFIRMLFAGVVFAFASGLGLAFGLGGQDTVKKMMIKWYDKSKAK